jgi:hypothetical protein
MPNLFTTRGKLLLLTFWYKPYPRAPRIGFSAPMNSFRSGKGSTGLVDDNAEATFYGE